MSANESMLIRLLPKLVFALLAAFMIVTSVRAYGDTTTLWLTAATITFVVCWANATHLLGVRPALVFVLLALCIGWFAEYMGASRGWFFGDYSYTDVLGPAIGEVPVVVPMMWFALTYMGYILTNLIAWHQPIDRSGHLGELAMLSFLAAMIVTAYDLGMETYMVYVLKAWIMEETDGAWFGETVQGFFGWITVAFAIIFSFRLIYRRRQLAPLTIYSRRHVLVPLLIYLGMMVGAMINGYPVETRTIAAFVMGIPVLSALVGWRYWLGKTPDQSP